MTLGQPRIKVNLMDLMYHYVFACGIEVYRKGVEDLNLRYFIFIMFVFIELKF